MSFGFSVGDFLAVGKLSLHLWRSFKDAPQEVAEVCRELSSVNIVIADLSDQAGSPNSLLNRRGASRKDELMTLCDNLLGALEELQDIYQRYRNMGRNAWMRVRLGERDLTALRSKLSLHSSLIETFVASLTMASVGRMEPMMMEVLQILRSMARGHGAGASSLLDAQGSDEADDGWRPLRSELQSEGIPMDFVQSHIDDIMTLVDEVIDDELLASTDDILPRDSVSQVGGQSPIPPANGPPRRSIPGNRQTGHHLQTPTVKPTINQPLRRNLEKFCPEDIQAATIRLSNYGFSLEQIRQPRPLPPPSPKSLRTKLWESSHEKAQDARHIQDLQEKDTQRQEYGERALCNAAYHCDTLAVLLILNEGVDVNAPTQRSQGPPIYLAIEGPEDDLTTTSMIELLVQYKGDVNVSKCKRLREDGKLKKSVGTNLFTAALRGKENVVKLLIENGVSVNKSLRRRQNGKLWKETALHQAAKKLHAPVVKVLLEGGAAVNFGEVYTPLDCCYKSKGEGSETEKLLIAAGGKLGSPGFR